MRHSSKRINLANIPCSNCGNFEKTIFSTVICATCTEKWRSQMCGGCGNSVKSNENSQILFNKKWHVACIEIFHPAELTTRLRNKSRIVRHNVLTKGRSKSGFGTFIFYKPSKELNKIDKQSSTDNNDTKSTPSNSFGIDSNEKLIKEEGEEEASSVDSELDENLNDSIKNRSQSSSTDSNVPASSSHAAFYSTTYKSLVQRIKAMGLLKDRIIATKNYPMSAIGSEIVIFFISSGQCKDNAECLEVGTAMMEQGYLTCVHGGSGSINDVFCDDASHLYSIDATPADNSGSKSIVKQGYLIKRGQMFKTWKKRWFVLNGTMLKYYKEEGGKLLGEMYLKLYTVNSTNIHIGGKSDRVIQLLSQSHEMFVEAESDLDFKDWCKVLGSFKSDKSMKFTLKKSHAAKLSPVT